MHKFPLGAMIIDRDVFDVRMVVGRVLDIDENNTPMYILKSDSQGLTWMTAELAEQVFEVYTKFTNN